MPLASFDARVEPVRARNVNEVLESLSEHWSPRTVAVVNDYDVRVVKALGEFTSHSHPDTDECFFVLSGRLTIRMPDGDVVLEKVTALWYRADTFISPTPRRKRRCSCLNQARRSTPVTARARSRPRELSPERLAAGRRRPRPLFPEGLRRVMRHPEHRLDGGMAAHAIVTVRQRRARGRGRQGEGRGRTRLTATPWHRPPQRAA